MIRVALIAGSYQPERCGVAHYTARLREALGKHGIESVVLTTHAAASAHDLSVQGVVHNWRATFFSYSVMNFRHLSLPSLLFILPSSSG